MDNDYILDHLRKQLKCKGGKQCTLFVDTKAEIVGMHEKKSEQKSGERY